jgi:hypothetical protein
MKEPCHWCEEPKEKGHECSDGDLKHQISEARKRDDRWRGIVGKMVVDLEAAKGRAG